jgi:hypothetical protein
MAPRAEVFREGLTPKGDGTRLILTEWYDRECLRLQADERHLTGSVGVTTPMEVGQYGCKGTAAAVLS